MRNAKDNDGLSEIGGIRSFAASAGYPMGFFQPGLAYRFRDALTVAMERALAQ